MKKNLRLIRVSLVALFAALSACGAFISLPLPGNPVPLVLQNLLVVLSGILMGPVYGSEAVGIFLLLGLVGFPVFSGGSGGLAVFAGPTGGYLVGYLFAAFAAGLIGRKRTPLFSALGSAAGFLIILICGTLRLRFYKQMPLSGALLSGFLPFLPGDALKCVICTFLALKVGPFIDSIAEKGSKKKNPGSVPESSTPAEGASEKGPEKKE